MNKADLAFVFPGQGSQAVGMLKDFSDHAIVKQTFQEASELLQDDLWALAQNGPKETLNQTIKTQPIMLTAGVATWRLWQSQSDIRPSKLAGHSLGEYSALVCAEVLTFADAIGLVAERARLMQAAVPEGQGAMAVVLGLTDDVVQIVCDEAKENQVCAPVNYNTPGQVVMAGNTEAIDRACLIAKEKGAKRAQKLPVSVPSHCALMQDAAASLHQQLQQIDMQAAKIPVVQNADVQVFESVNDIQTALAKQLFSPVRWVETIQYFSAEGITQAVECGPGKVLMGLGKRIDKSVASRGIFDQKSLTTTLEAVEASTS